SRSVARELGRRAVRVPDDDLRAVGVSGKDFEDAVRAHAEVVVTELADERAREGLPESGALDEHVIVAEPVPLLEGDPAHGDHPNEGKGPAPARAPWVFRSCRSACGPKEANGVPGVIGFNIRDAGAPFFLLPFRSGSSGY